MNSLIGTYECKVDAKGRLMLPVALKKQLAPELQDGFVLKRAVFQECLELYPMQEWNVLMQKVNKLNRFKKKNNDFMIISMSFGTKKNANRHLQSGIFPATRKSENELEQKSSKTMFFDPKQKTIFCLKMK